MSHHHRALIIFFFFSAFLVKMELHRFHPALSFLQPHPISSLQPLPCSSLLGQHNSMLHSKSYTHREVWLSLLIRRFSSRQGEMILRKHIWSQSEDHQIVGSPMAKDISTSQLPHLWLRGHQGLHKQDGSNGIVSSHANMKGSPGVFANAMASRVVICMR